MFTDPDGREYLVCGPNGNDGKCTTVSDEEFWKERKALEKTGNVYTGSRDFFETGQILNADGGVVATYANISIDSQAGQAIFAIRGAVDPIPMATAQFFGISAVLGTGGGFVLHYAVAATLAPTVTTLGLRAAPAVGAASQFGPGIIEKAVNYVTSNPAKVAHIFDKAQHNLGPLVSKLGGQENTVRAVLNGLNGKLPSAGTFETTVRVAGESVVVRGSVVGGVPKIGTMFIK